MIRDLGFMVQGFMFKLKGSGFRGHDLKYKVSCLELRAQGLGSRV